MSTRCKIPFKGTKEQEEKLLALIESLKDKKGPLMPVMQGAQEIYGYLPYEVLALISEKMNVPMADLYGVATFYAQFTLVPKGEYQIAVCLGTACYVKGSANVIDKVKEILKIDVGGCTDDGKFSLDATRCIGACGLAPVMTINDDVYGRLTPDQVPGILEKYMG